VVDPAALRHRNPVSPYAGHTLRGVVRQTWLAGRPAGPDQRTGQLASAAKRVLVRGALVSGVLVSGAQPRSRPRRGVVSEDPAAGRGAPDFGGLPDVASRALGGAVLYANDEFYADAHSLIDPRPAAHDPAAFGARGKVYDGWETRRRREPGEDFVIIRLAAPAIVRGVNIDTAHFRGNYPPFGWVDGATLLGYPTAAEVRAAAWTPLADKTDLAGNRANLVPVTAPDRLVTHVRLTIHPDGGVARLRVFGEVCPIRGGSAAGWTWPRPPRAVGWRRAATCSSPRRPTRFAPGRAQVMSTGGRPPAAATTGTTGWW